jgi:hypothetical protein
MATAQSLRRLVGSDRFGLRNWRLAFLFIISRSGSMCGALSSGQEFEEFP